MDLTLGTAVIDRLLALLLPILRKGLLESYPSDWEN